VAGAVCSGDAACQALSKMRSSGKLLLDKAPIALVITAKTVEYIEVETNVCNAAGLLYMHAHGSILDNHSCS
jgi:hypothetical protein